MTSSSQRESKPEQPTQTTTSHSASWLRPWRYLGFQKSYNVPLFIIFAGAMLGFSLAKYPTFSYSYAVSPLAPVEEYYYSRPYYMTALQMHISTSIICGTLLVFQFVPIIRHRAMLFHRINGYVIILLIFMSNITALMVARRAFGGSLSTQAAVGVLAIISTIGVILAYYNIKKLQIEQHRAWMLRTMFYLGTIITTRLVMIISAQVISKIGGYYIAMSCGEVLSAGGAVNGTACAGSAGIGGMMPVKAAFGDSAVGVAASFRMTFGMALWMAIFLHVVGVEIYLALTPREAQRLRMVSYGKQLAAGYKNPGSAGLVVEKFGDAEAWQKM